MKKNEIFKKKTQIYLHILKIYCIFAPILHNAFLKHLENDTRLYKNRARIQL